MHTTVTCPSAEITIWQSRLDKDILAALAAIYRRAADLIREHGYDPRPEGSCSELTGPHLQRHRCPDLPKTMDTGCGSAARSLGPVVMQVQG